MKTKESSDERSPFMGSWKKFYMLVLTNLVVMISLFYAFKTYFS